MYLAPRGTGLQSTSIRSAETSVAVTSAGASGRANVVSTISLDGLEYSRFTTERTVYECWVAGARWSASNVVGVAGVCVNRRSSPAPVPREMMYRLARGTGSHDRSSETEVFEATMRFVGAGGNVPISAAWLGSTLSVRTWTSSMSSALPGQPATWPKLRSACTVLKSTSTSRTATCTPFTYKNRSENCAEWAKV